MGKIKINRCNHCKTKEVKTRMSFVAGSFNDSNDIFIFIFINCVNVQSFLFISIFFLNVHIFVSGWLLRDEIRLKLLVSLPHKEPDS